MVLSVRSVCLMDVNSFILIVSECIIEQGHDSISKEKVFQKTKRTILMNIQVNRRKSFRFCAFIKVVESQ